MDLKDWTRNEQMYGTGADQNKQEQNGPEHTGTNRNVPEWTGKDGMGWNKLKWTGTDRNRQIRQKQPEQTGTYCKRTN